MQPTPPPEAGSERAAGADARTARRRVAVKIEDYALLGNCHSAALVSRGGSIDWLCFPRFDSAACCAALLGDEEHGRWLLGPTDPDAQVSRAYQDGSTILETRVETPTGVARVVDFLSMEADRPRLVRIVYGDRGRVDFRMELVLRFDYGSLVPWVTRMDDGALRLIAGSEMCILRTPVDYRGEDLKTIADFPVAEGDVVPFELTWTPSYGELPGASDPLALLDRTRSSWEGWSARFGGGTPYDDIVKRSLVTLKALTYYPSGGIVAAPTTSLPERIGGNRNWDYRYTWLRDATLTLSAMVHAGYYDEAVAWRDWLLRAVAGAPDQMQIMYGVAGDRRLPETELPWLTGYEHSLPVRIGNAASQQVQLDVYGEIMSALHAARRSGLGKPEDGWDLQKALLTHLDTIWNEPDQGIWEMRGEPRHFVHSKLMAWLAYDRTVRSAERYGLEGPIDGYRATRDAIRASVEQNGFDAERNTFVQSFGARPLDASLLFLGTTGFLHGDDPRLLGTIAAIERELISDGLVMRYRPDEASDGVDGAEGVFLACSFWLADAYRLVGRTDDAIALYERVAALCNDVGLLAEEYDPKARRMLGNFPQAFSHLALVNSALDIGGFVRRDDTHAADGTPASTWDD